MKKAGIVLIVLQVLAIFGTISNGGFATMGVPKMIGYFLPAIIGIILIVVAKRRED